MDRREGRKSHIRWPSANTFELQSFRSIVPGHIALPEKPIPTPAVDILIINWNGAFFLRHLIPLALEVTDERHRFSIWDNASRDGSWDVLAGLARDFPGRVQPFRSLQNKRHGTGLRWLLARTDREVVVVLDCDATPLRKGWVDILAAPVLDGAAAHGIPHGDPRFVHPSCLCTTRSTLRDLKVDVRPDYPRYDVMQRLSVSAEGAGRRLEYLDEDGDYLFSGFGRTYGDELIYHHWFGTRVNPIAGMGETPEGRTTAGLAESQETLQSWLEQRGQLRSFKPDRKAGLGETLGSVLKAHGPAWLS